MLKSIKNFARLCVLKGNPDAVDGGTFTLVLLFLIFWVLDSILFLVVALLSSIESSPSTQTLIDEVFRVLGNILGQLFVALCIYVVLHVRKIPQKFRQTYTCYLGVSSMITLVSLLFIGVSVLISSHHEISAFFSGRDGNLLLAGTILIVVFVVYFVSKVWTVLAFAYVLNKSMEIKFWHGGVVAVILIYSPVALKDFAYFPKFVLRAIGYAWTFFSF